LGACRVSRLLRLYYEASSGLRETVGAFLGEEIQPVPFIIDQFCITCFHRIYILRWAGQRGGAMADEKAPPEFMSALVTEHFVLQSTSSATISESGSRVSIYLSALSSSLVAIGFASSKPHALASLAFTVLPTVFILGLFTIVRLIDTSVANIISLRRMELIRAYYAALAPLAPPYFAADDSVAGNHGVRYGRWSFLFTMASMVIVVNSVLGGATVGLFCALAVRTGLLVATVIGVVAGLIVLALSLRYEHRRLTPVVLSSPGSQRGDELEP
jgi:hypothetical protein